jgi:hypothetical protein
MTRRRVVGGALVVGAVVVALLLVPRLVRDTDAEPRSASPPSGLCTDPVLVTSRNVTWNDGDFVVDQDMWNNHGGTQTLRACSYHSWSVTANQPDTPDVNAYPNVHRDFDAPSLSSFTEITSRFASVGPGSGTYNFAYDVWLNGVATKGSSEIMIWTDTHGPEPQVARQGAFTSGGVRYAVYRGGRYIAFLGPDRMAGEVDLLAFFRYAVDRGWLPADSTIGQIDYGVEIRSTGGRPLDFAVTDFALTTR